MIRFNSKRNTVYLKDNVVIKEYMQTTSALFECKYLNDLREAGVKVPKVLDVIDNTLYIEYIDGISVIDFIEDHSLLDMCDVVAFGITKWFYDFYIAVNHDISKEIRGDVNGRNFIIKDEEIYGVDFEEKVYGEISVDLGRFLAYLSTYTLNNTQLRDRLRLKLLSLFSESFNIDSKVILEEEKKEIREMEIRRSLRNS